MKIYSLIENTTTHQCMHTEHGLSLYIETEKHNILFDSGQTGIFTENAEKLDVDLKKVDIVILSHGHYDHSGGLLRFLECNQTAPVYLSRHAFADVYNAEETFIGIDPKLMESDRLIFVDDLLQIDAGITLYSCNKNEVPYPADNFGLTMKTEAGFVPDDFRHEQYLLLEESGKKVLISGCSHKGILNITEWFNPDVLIGGFHFMKLDPAVSHDADVLQNAAEALLCHNTTYYTCHCTGVEQFSFLKEIMGEQLHYLAAGDVIEI